MVISDAQSKAFKQVFCKMLLILCGSAWENDASLNSELGAVMAWCLDANPIPHPVTWDVLTIPGKDNDSSLVWHPAFNSTIAYMFIRPTNKFRWNFISKFKRFHSIIRVPLNARLLSATLILDQYTRAAVSDCETFRTRTRTQTILFHLKNMEQCNTSFK